MATEWVRLFPYPMRDVDEMHRFRTWDVVRLRARATTSDQRPESLRPNPETATVVRHIGTSGKGWAERHQLVDHVRQPSMCAVLAGHDESRLSLGAVALASGRARVEATRRPPAEVAEAADRAQSQAVGLFSAAKTPLEPVPWAFHLHFDCPACAGHKLKMVDWEISQTWRSWRDMYGDADAVERMLVRWGEMLAGDRPSVFVGNQHRLPHVWMALGIHSQWHRS